MSLRKEGSVKDKELKPVLRYNEIKKLINKDLERRLSKSIITHDIGLCKICGGHTSSGMIHVCDVCWEKYGGMADISGH